LILCIAVGEFDKHNYLLTGHKCPSSGLAAAVPCPSGQYQSNTGQTACLSCTAGSQCADQTAAPVACLAGTYSPADAITCTACLAGEQKR